MAVRWTITFKTLTDRTGLVKVYDSSYSGDPIAIEPAANAFSVTRQQTEFFQPVVPDTGYLRVIDNDIVAEAIEDIHPLGALDRPVEFYLDNVLQWRGYISPESFTMPWEPAPREVSFPVMGVLNALESVEIQDNGTDLQSIAAFIKEILTATGFSWDNIIMAKQMASVDIYAVFPEFRLRLSRFAFIKKNQSQNTNDPDWTFYVGESYYTVLSRLCAYFGWTASQYGANLVLTNSRTDISAEGFNKITWSALSSLAANYAASITQTAVERPSLSLLSLDFDGVEHKISISNGCKKVTVRAALDAGMELYPRLLFNGEIVSTYQNVTSDSHVETAYGHLKFLSPEFENSVFYSYAYDSEHSAWIVSTNTPPTGSTFNQIPRADLVKGASYLKASGPADPNPDYTKYLRLCFQRIASGAQSGVLLPAYLPLVKMTAPESGLFLAGGALCISAYVRANWWIDWEESEESGVVVDGQGMTQLRTANCNLRMSIKIGDKYYDGSDWVDSTQIIKVKVDADSSSAGKIRNTNNDRYEGANGFVIPISEDMNGRLEITIYAPDDIVPGFSEVNTYFLSDFNVGYYNNSFADNQNDGLRISSLTGRSFKDDKEVVIYLSSLEGVVVEPSSAYLFYGDSPIGSDEIFTYCDEAQTELAQPEYWLLDSLVKAYSKPSKWMTLEVSQSSDIQMFSIVTYQGKKYLVVGMESDYEREHIKLYIASYE